ncbi:uncharacterized protein SCHCODRAFT_02209947 [Schizophyllum commune H4-8]|uniref:uncharacterized protein n=1 Tax=Schizophyllum commune (strain H4-8 / FGSC 9210) TaxID=578458 RepID=UPI00215FA096|nr:uncharacterized protein SCHCODRAFT_02209947 [Schizophyllum commune H4-8]KAI5894473.1 hypothetical protein SCHCODRAFT_02209947 [Schizophyllum commune H4-8]
MERPFKHSPGDFLVIKRSHDEPPLHRLYEVEVDGADLNVMYCKLIAPAFRVGDVPAAYSGSIPDAAGAFVRVYNRCPGDVDSGLLMRQYRRYPRLLGDLSATPIRSDQIIAPVCRVVEQLDKTDLVIEHFENGKIRPALVPMDRNDVWCTELIGPGEDIARPTIICVNGCTEGRAWEDAFTGEVRYCRKCGKMMHVECLEADGPEIVDLSVYADWLEEFDQEYLRYLLRARRPKSRMPYKPPEFGKHLEVDEDVDDKDNKIPWPPKVTYAEVACLPIRRRTSPGDAPQTNEILIQHVLDLLERGEVREGDPVPHPAEGGWFHKVAPQAALRAVKDILCRDLSDARTDNMRWYICIGCHKQLV